MADPYYRYAAPAAAAAAAALPLERGQNFNVEQIEELCSDHTSAVSNEQIDDIVMFLCRSDGHPERVRMSTKILSLLQLNGSSFFTTASPMITDAICTGNPRQFDLFDEYCNNEFEAAPVEIEKEVTMAEVMKELGYGCTVNTSHCKELLSLFLPLNDVTLSKLVGTIARTHNGLEDTQNVHLTFCSALDISSIDSSMTNSWNIDVLVDSIMLLAPKTNWTHVMENLDHEGFNIPDEISFSLLMSMYAKACQDPFPLHAICGSIWKNAEGQLSLLRHAVAASPDTITFAHCSRKTYVDTLLLNAHGNQAWFCLDLLEVLCQLAERGFFSSVRVMLEYPINNCPEVLLVGIAQINTAYNLLQYEVTSVVFPSILKESTESGTIHHLWRINPTLVLRGFVDAHSTDPNNLFKILNICQELKILSLVLETTPFPFSIRLASISSRNEHVNLEKWLHDNLNTYKEAFSEDCLLFLKEVLYDVASEFPDSTLQKSRASILNVYQETCSTFFKVLQAHLAQLGSHELFEELKRLYSTSNPPNQNIVATNSNSDDIEAEANAYFHQMFSGQLTIDVMVQMLARFKESSEKRKQGIFECMIANLFEEYKFFPKYPDKQLKLAAVLFGSLIKHQLVTHLALGIALRGVLDALRKSVDSKMFVFGTKALEQFIDRLVEWPQYCNHILQISHLRGTHTELVSVIERALARVSSSPSESSGGNTPHADQQQGSTTSVDTMEPSEASWQLMSSSSSQFVQQLSPQQRHQGLLGDRLKATITAANYTKPVLSHAGQSSLVSAPVDSVTVQKAITSQTLQTRSAQQPASVTSVVSSPHGFLRPSRSIASTGMLRQPSYNTGFGAALNIETLVAAAERRDTPIETPASEVQDKILFMINNISTTNMESKAKEFTEVFEEQYYPWFAQYMVMKRASIEPNFHDLYLKFLDKVNSRSLNKEIVKATYENCKVLLRSDLIKSSSEERSLLKNLGSWLGKFTIGRNQALLAKEIDPKVLIIEAYEKGLMIAVIPFTSKILEPCQSSLAYQPPNPWTMGILGLLTEIYNLPNLKMNLKFDIEVLFKNLSVDMKDVKPTSLLKDRVREVEGNPDFSNKDVTASQPPVIPEVNSGIIPTLNQVELQPDINNTSHLSSHPNVLTQYSAPPHLASNTMVEDDKVGALVIPERVPSAQGHAQLTQSPSPFSLSQLLTIIPDSDSYIKINPKLSSMGPQLQFHRIIQVAMDRAIKEIVSPVIQRSVTIACRTTKELVLKDYAMESDDSVISRAARLMVGTLAGSLAHVTCKEPLRGALLNQLRNVLQNLTSNNERAEQIVQILTTDHLDLGCAVIENVASEKAVELIDAEIGPSFASMRKPRDLAGSAYYVAGTYAQGPFARVPEALRPKPGHLSTAQLRVYDDFIRNVWQNQPSQNPNVLSAGPPVPQQLDLVPEDSNRGSSHVPSVSSTHCGANDGVMQPNSEISSVTAAFPAVSSAELHVVEESGAVVPPSPSTHGTDRLSNVISESLLTTGDALEKYQQVAQKLESLIAKEARDTEIQGVVAEVPEIILKCVSRDAAALAVAQKVFKSLYDNASSRVHVDAYLAILIAIRDVCKLVVKELTSWVIYSDEDRKFNKEITVSLICSELLNLAEFNVHLAKLMDGGRNKAATEFAIAFVHALLLREPRFYAELYNVCDVLAKLAAKSGSQELFQLQELIEITRNTAANPNPLSSFAPNKEEKAKQIRDKKVLPGRTLTNREEYSVTESASGDPAGFSDKVSLWFDDWCQICEHPGVNDNAYSHYISQLQQNGWLKGDDVTDRFFRILTVLSVARCLATEQVINPGSLSHQSTQQLQHLSFSSIDAYAKLVVLILKYCSGDQGSSKLLLLNKVLSVTIKVIQKEAEDRKSFFNPRPYFRLFVNWLLDLASPDPVLDGANLQILTSFASTFLALQPLKVPGWSFAWLELVSHRSFMPKLLTTNTPKGWGPFQRLLVALFKFMEPYLRNAEMGEPVQFLYRGTLRVLLVLLHDFPEFLCDYHFSFCDVIPPSCIQMRNVILSAFPRNMRLPDPSTPNLKIDLLAEISQSPRILSDVDGALKAKLIKADIDESLKTRPEASFLSELKQRLLLPPSEASLAGTHYNVPLINSLVLYVGMQAIQQLQNKSSQHAATQQMTHSPPMDIFHVGAPVDIFQSLIKNLDTEGRYHFLNAVANQLRYPNNHTHYFSFVLLYLFGEASQDIIQEQITRVLLERLIVNRPHPWGLLITFIELIKNPRYNFWNRPFTRCAPEIERLFESVSRSCGGPKTVDDGMVSGGITDGNH